MRFSPASLLISHSRQASSNVAAKRQPDQPLQAAIAAMPLPPCCGIIGGDAGRCQRRHSSSGEASIGGVNRCAATNLHSDGDGRRPAWRPKGVHAPASSRRKPHAERGVDTLSKPLYTRLPYCRLVFPTHGFGKDNALGREYVGALTIRLMLGVTRSSLSIYVLEE
jgi:hypothetical protein